MQRQFSVIVPIYKVEQYLHKCVESILGQTFTNFELLLVDDGSPDGCPQICDDYAQRDKRVRVIHKTNGGLVSARNTGIKAATGKYICYVDGDDWIAENLLETVWNKVLQTAAPDVIVFQGVRQFAKKQVPLPAGPKEGLYTKERLNNEVYPYMMYDNRKPFCNGLIFPVAWNKIYRREFLLEHYCREENIRMGEDNAFVFECLFAAKTVFFLEDSLYFYNQLNAGSMTNSYDADRFENNKRLTDYMTRNMGGKSSVIDEQLNAFKAYWVMMAVFHEVKCRRKLFESAKHISKSIKKVKALEDIHLKGLPKSAQVYIGMLKMHLYIPALCAAILVTKKRG
ncbi:glycosyltransferase family 2 protein [uncultured Subdoligranulum sp.]|uniref:glycosyltransferase family 2 protein n=1 Tax=uncultured Subdoligranulum sp. TaxID=512298 RepID=UPI0025FB0C85|nr:glycosyltransferase family 2 protein [uncultured Subdoligranulum sp.]